MRFTEERVRVVVEVDRVSRPGSSEERLGPCALSFQGVTVETYRLLTGHRPTERAGRRRGQPSSSLLVAMRRWTR